MIRTQIQLSEEQVRKLKAMARRERISLAEAIRRCVNLALERQVDRGEIYDRASRIVGTLADRDRASDLASDHDRYLEDAFE